MRRALLNSGLAAAVVGVDASGVTVSAIGFVLLTAGALLISALWLRRRGA